MIRSCPACHQKNRVPAARLVDAGRCGRCGAALPVPDAPIAVDAAQFDDIVRSSSVPVLVDFWAAWCGPCKMAAPEVERAAQRLAGKALVLKVDTEQEPELAARFGVRGIPNFVVLEDGRRVSQHSGLVDHREMERWVIAATN